MDETFLYQDDARTSPKVLVSKGRLKVGDSTYSLETVSDVALTEFSKVYRQEPRLWRRLVWFFMFGIVPFSPFTGYYIILLPVVAGMLAIREYLRDEHNKCDQHNHYHEAELTLTKAGTTVRILIGRFPTRAPLTPWELFRIGDNTLPAETLVYFENVKRVKAISEAVGQAIAQRSLVGPS